MIGFILSFYESTRQECLASLKARADDPEETAAAVFPRLVYGPDHPYGRPDLGTPGSVQSITRADVAAFHRRIMVPGNAALVVVGDVRPDAVAAALVATVPVEALALAGGAFRDGTRVAGSDAALWTAIFQENRAPLLRALARFEDQFARFRQALEASDHDTLLAWWDAARSRRSCFDGQNVSNEGGE